MSCLQDSILKIDTSLQDLIDSILNAPSLGLMLLTAWRLGRAVAVKIVEAVLAERAGRPTIWPLCPQCDARLYSKGFVERQLNSLIGTICFKRRGGRCPNGCKIGQVAPLDDELGLAPNQQTSPGLKRAACALAVFVPFETASVLLNCLTDLYVSPAAVWNWVQAAGKEAMRRLADALLKLESGECPSAHQIDEQTAQLPLILGADGVMVPFRPDSGNPSGAIVWREVKVGILARLGQHLTRAGKKVTQLKRRRSVERRFMLARWTNQTGQAMVHFSAATIATRGIRIYTGRSFGSVDLTRHILEKLKNYLESHREHIHYKRFKELGLPLGS